MATLVTGSTGFVGINIVKTLAQRGHDVVCFDVAAADALVRKYLEPVAERVTFIQGDILNKGDVERLASQHNITKIVHAAAFTPNVAPSLEIERSRAIVDINVVGTANLLDLACGLSLKRFLYVSSEVVYGDSRDPEETLYEDSTLDPRNLYAVTKYTSEMLTRRYGQLHGFQTVSARLTSPFGPMERVNPYRGRMSLIYEWTGNVVRSEPIRAGDRDTGRDYTYVLDTAVGVCAILDAPSLSYDVYNVSAGRSITPHEVIQVLQDLRPALQVIDDPTHRGRPPGAKEDVTRLREDLGFTASFDFASAIRDYIQWRETFPFLD